MLPSSFNRHQFLTSKGFLFECLTDEISRSVREFFTRKIYEYVERANSKAKLHDLRRIAHENFKNRSLNQFLEIRFREKYPLIPRPDRSADGLTEKTKVSSLLYLTQRPSI